MAQGSNGALKQRVSEPMMSGAIVQFLLSAAVIVVAGAALTRYADAIAHLTGIGRLLAGSLFLAVATSLPELTVDISAVRIGTTDIAVGDLLGSSLFNFLILAVLDCLYVPRLRERRKGKKKGQTLRDGHSATPEAIHPSGRRASAPPSDRPRILSARTFVS